MEDSLNFRPLGKLLGNFYVEVIETFVESRKIVSSEL
jgi:hypothetical protein